MRLGDIAFVTKLAGFEHSKYIQDNCKHEKIDSSFIPLFIGRTVQNGQINNNFDWYISKDISDCLQRSKLNKKCIVLPYVGTLGDLAIFDGSYEAHLGSNIAKIELNDDAPYIEEYIYYFLKSPFGQALLLREEQGMIQKNITMEAIRNVSLPSISIDEQIKLVNVLQSIDIKINVNHSINKELEEMAKEIYDYWFVQFDYPDNNGRPYKSSGGAMVYNPILKREIPEGWSDSIVKDCIEPLERGISYTSESIENPNGYPMINLACYTKQGDYRTGEMKYYTGEVKDRHKAYPYDMLIACTDMTQGADVIGRPILASEESEWFVYSMDLAKITPVNIAKMYLYYTLRTYFYHKYIKPFASGTTVKHLNTQGVESYKIVVPASDVQEKFENLITPIKHQQMLLINEILELEQQRNELLPLLMTGQVKLK